MPDRNSLGDPFIKWQHEMDDHLETARFKRLCARVPFIVVICLSIIGILAHWRHAGVVQHYCAPPTIACDQLNDPTTKVFWTGWMVAITPGLAVICGGTFLALLIARIVPRYSWLLRLSGPFQDPDRRRHFWWYFWITLILSAGLLALTILESLE